MWQITVFLFIATLRYSLACFHRLKAHQFLFAHRHNNASSLDALRRILSSRNWQLDMIFQSQWFELQGKSRKSICACRENWVWNKIILLLNRWCKEPVLHLRAVLGDKTQQCCFSSKINENLTRITQARATKNSVSLSLNMIHMSGRCILLLVHVLNKLMLMQLQMRLRTSNDSFATYFAYQNDNNMHLLALRTKVW